MFFGYLFLTVFLISSAARAEVIPGLPYEKMQTTDADGRVVTYYVTHPDKPSPLVLFIQDSGCDSLFDRRENGTYTGEISVLMKRAAKDRVTLLAVEKPFAIPFSKIPQGQRFSSLGCPVEYLEQDTFEIRLKQLQAALREAQALPWVQQGPLLVVGRQDGGNLAAMLARGEPGVTDMGLVSTGTAPGAWYLFDKFIRSNMNEREQMDAMAETESIVEKIMADGNSINKWYADFPYRYWSSFFRTFPVDDILHTNARVYLIKTHPATPTYLSSVALLTTALQGRGRDVTIRSIKYIDPLPPPEGQEKMLADLTQEYTLIIDWFLANNGIAP